MDRFEFLVLDSIGSISATANVTVEYYQPPTAPSINTEVVLHQEVLHLDLSVVTATGQVLAYLFDSVPAPGEGDLYHDPGLAFPVAVGRYNTSLNPLRLYYVPAGFNGVTTFVFRGLDPNAFTNPSAVTITSFAPAVAVNQFLAVSLGETLTITLSSSGTVGSVHYVITGLPSAGLLTTYADTSSINDAEAVEAATEPYSSADHLQNFGNNFPDRVLYTAPNTLTTVSFGFAVSDGRGFSEPGSVVINVVDLAIPAVETLRLFNRSATFSGPLVRGDVLTLVVSFDEGVWVNGSAGDVSLVQDVGGTPLVLPLVLEAGEPGSSADSLSAALVFAVAIPDGIQGVLGSTTLRVVGDTDIVDDAEPAHSAALVLPNVWSPGGIRGDIAVDTAAPQVAGLAWAVPQGIYGYSGIIYIDVLFSEAVTIGAGIENVSLALSVDGAVAVYHSKPVGARICG